MRVIITGPKGSGKSTLGKALSQILNIPFIETDTHLEDLFFQNTGERLLCRDIYKNFGEDEFRSWEKKAVLNLKSNDWCLIATGGGTLFDSDLRKELSSNSLIILLKAADEFIWERIKKIGLPPFLEGTAGFDIFRQRNKNLYETIERICDIEFSITADNEKDAHFYLIESLSNYLMLKMHSPSTFGEIIRTTTFGESHGVALGAILDGVRAGIEISENDIQVELDRRRPGQSTVTTQRNESDTVHILSGTFEGKTTGTPLCMVVYNQDQDSSKYDVLRDIFRPGHADFTFWKKFGIRDHRGGGRSSGRETIGRVVSGAVAKKILGQKGITIIAYAEEIAGIKGDIEDISFIEKNPVRAADPIMASVMEEAILKARKEQDSVGGIVKLLAKNVPAGLGDPVFFKLDARLSMALFSIGAVKGVEIGLGFGSAKLRGSSNNDTMSQGTFLSNNAGGILGGISTGQDISARIAVKPTPSISQKQETLDISGKDRDIIIEGRHDPCIVPRIIPVIEAMTALVLLDALEIQERMK